jgi:hypothetical protein
MDSFYLTDKLADPFTKKSGFLKILSIHLATRDDAFIRSSGFYHSQVIPENERKF